MKIVFKRIKDSMDNYSFNSLELGNVNKNYKKNKYWGIKLLDIILYIYIFCMFAYFVFNIIFIRAQVIGISMQPLFNSNLDQSLDPKEYETSIYQDVAFANRYNKGKNGDIILLEILENGETTSNIVIKRIIASGGQRVTLRRESDGFYYYYVSNNINELGEKLNEPYVSKQARRGMDINYYNTFCSKAPIIHYLDDGMGAYITVPQNEVFVLGDNRPVSKDSHIFGTVKTNAILGKVSFYYAYNENFFSYVWKSFCSLF